MAVRRPARVGSSVPTITVICREEMSQLSGTAGNVVDGGAGVGARAIARPRTPPRTAARPPLRPYDVAVAALIPIYVWRLQDVVPVLGSLQVPTIVSVIATAIFLLGGHAQQALKRLRSPILVVATFILVWMVASIPMSLYPGLSFSFVVSDHSKTFLMMLLLASSIRSAFDVERLLFVNLLGAAVYCFKILTTFSVGADGRLNSVLYYDANDLAMMVVCTVPVAVYFLLPRARLWQRPIALACLTGFILTIVRAGSRGGFLGLVAVVLYLLLGFRAVKARTRFVTVGVLAAMLFGLAGPQFWELMGTVLHPQEDYNATADAGRMAVWERGIGYMATHPLTGVGVMAFGTAEGTISDIASRQDEGIGVKWSVAHNSFVQIGAELGLPGIIAFVALLFRMLQGGWRLSRSPHLEGPNAKSERALADTLIGMLLGYIVAGFFLSQAYSAYLYATCGILAGLVLMTSPRMPLSAPKKLGGRSRAFSAGRRSRVSA